MKAFKVDDLMRLEEDGADYFLLDVRENEEVEKWPMEGMPYYHIPLSDLQERMNEVPKDKKVVVFCLKGGRSEMACKFLEENGYMDTTNLIGGMIAWQDYQDNY